MYSQTLLTSYTPSDPRNTEGEDDSDKDTINKIIFPQVNEIHEKSSY